jgi:hypothetical protein
MLRFAADENFNLVIEDLLLLAQWSREGEWEGQIRYLPLR